MKRDRLGFHSENTISQVFILEEKGLFRSKEVATERVNVQNMIPTAPVSALITIRWWTHFIIHPENWRWKPGGRPGTTEKGKFAVKKQRSERVCEEAQCPNVGGPLYVAVQGGAWVIWHKGIEMTGTCAPLIFSHMYLPTFSFFIY